MENDAGTNQNAIVLGSSGSAAKVGVELRYNNVGRIWTTTDGSAILKPSIMGLSDQESETTALMINGSNVVGTRELGSNAFTSTTIPTNNSTLTNGAGYITGITINSGTGLTGGTTGTSFTLNLDLNELSTTTDSGNADFFAIVNSGGSQFKIAPGDIDISTLNNDSGFTTNTGIIIQSR